MVSVLSASWKLWAPPGTVRVVIQSKNKRSACMVGEKIVVGVPCWGPGPAPASSLVHARPGLWPGRERLFLRLHGAMGGVCRTGGRGSMHPGPDADRDSPC